MNQLMSELTDLTREIASIEDELDRLAEDALVKAHIEIRQLLHA